LGDFRRGYFAGFCTSSVGETGRIAPSSGYRKRQKGIEEMEEFKKILILGERD